MQPNDRLRIARQKAGYESAADAARRLGISYGTYAGHENGNRGMKMEELQRYSTAFGIPLNWLAFGDDPRGPSINVAGLIDLSGEIEELKGLRSYRRISDEQAFNRVFVPSLASDDYQAYIFDDMPRASLIERNDLVIISKSRFLGMTYPDGYAVVKLNNGKSFFREVKRELPFASYSLYFPEMSTVGGVSIKEHYRMIAIVREYEPDTGQGRSILR